VHNQGSSVLRFFSMCGLGLLFLAISPKLRGNVQDAIGSVYMNVQSYAPFSYVALGVLVIIGLMRAMYRGAQPR
jgi:hypothetical protein